MPPKVDIRPLRRSDAWFSTGYCAFEVHGQGDEFTWNVRDDDGWLGRGADTTFRKSAAARVEVFMMYTGEDRRLVVALMIHNVAADGSTLMHVGNTETYTTVVHPFSVAQHVSVADRPRQADFGDDIPLLMFASGTVEAKPKGGEYTLVVWRD